MLFFLLVWLFVFWIGAIALEATGLERSRARFQALSALSGTGFTTSQAEDVVEHPGRRRIVTYLIFLGNAGILTFLVALVIYLRTGLAETSTAAIFIIVGVLFVTGIIIWTGLINILTNIISRLFFKRKTGISLDGMLYQSGELHIARLHYNPGESGTKKETAIDEFKESGLNIIGVQRGRDVMLSVASGFTIKPGDYIVCSGTKEALNRLVRC